MRVENALREQTSIINPNHYRITKCSVDPSFGFSYRPGSQLLTVSLFYTSKLKNGQYLFFLFDASQPALKTSKEQACVNIIKLFPLRH